MWSRTVFIIAALFITPQLHAQNGVSFNELASYRGFTICYEGPDDVKSARQSISFVLIGQDSISMKEVIAHELKHQDQHARYNSCDVFQIAYNRPRGFLQFEAEAYMAGYCAVKVALVDTALARRRIVNQLYASLGAGTIREEIETELNRFSCPT